jgi:hypothetical protein
VFKKNRKTVFANGLCQGLSAQVVFKKIEKPSLPTASARGSRHRIFYPPLFADSPASRPSAKKISKTVNLNPR